MNKKTLKHIFLGGSVMVVLSWAGRLVEQHAPVNISEDKAFIYYIPAILAACYAIYAHWFIR